MTADVLLRSEEVCQAIPGLSFRKIDYWVRTGLITSVDDDGVPYTDDRPPGSGASRFYPPIEVAVAERMVALTAAGFGLKAAHDLARTFVDGTSTVCLGVYDLTTHPG